MKQTLYMRLSHRCGIYLTTLDLQETHDDDLPVYFRYGEKELASSCPTYYKTPLEAKEAGTNAGYEVVERLEE